MTTEALDLLAQLTNLGDAEAEELKRGRSNFRSPLIRFKCDIPAQTPEVEHEMINGRDNAFFMMALSNVEVYDSATAIADTEALALKIRLPRANARGETKMNFNSETAQMLASLKTQLPAAENITSFFGLKGVEMEERVHKFMGREQKDGEWGDAEMDVRYYHVTKVGGSLTTNGAKPAAVGPTQAAIDRALELVKDAGATGIKEADFNKLVTTDPLIKADKAFGGYVVSGAFVTQNAAVGRTEDGMLVWVE